MENNEIKEENVNEEVEKKNKKKTIIAIIAIIVIIAIILIALIINNTIKDKSGIVGEETSNLAEADLDLTHMGVTQYPTNWSEDVTIYEDKSLEDEKGKLITYYVPIPDGYEVSKASGETTVAEGLVIYEGEDEVNDSNVDEAKKSRNQWVWIPVNPSNVYYEDEDGVKYSIYYKWSDTSGLEVDVTSKREPYIATSTYNYYEDKNLDTHYSEEDSLAELYTEMRQNYEEMIASIEKYGGFYIGRYELGDNEATEERKTEDVEIECDISSIPVVMQEKWPYNYINWYQAYDLCSDLGANEIVKTNLIYGTLWDNTLISFVSTGARDYSEITDSKSWGNNSSSSFGSTGTNNLQMTGNNEVWKTENIYDLAGNLWEWTLEAYNSDGTNSSYRYIRGGGYNVSGTSNHVAFRINKSPDTVVINTNGNDYFNIRL